MMSCIRDVTVTWLHGDGGIRPEVTAYAGTSREPPIRHAVRPSPSDDVGSISKRGQDSAWTSSNTAATRRDGLRITSVPPSRASRARRSAWTPVLSTNVTSAQSRTRSPNPRSATTASKSESAVERSISPSMDRTPSRTRSVRRWLIGSAFPIECSTETPSVVSGYGPHGYRAQMRRAIAAVQGVSYVLGGAWPLLHMRSFEAVTGPKVDEWLERTTAGIMVAIGAAELWAARRDEVTPALAAIGAGTAATLGIVSAVYASSGRIRKIYLADEAFEAALLAGWTLAARDAAPALTD